MATRAKRPSDFQLKRRQQGGSLRPILFLVFACASLIAIHLLVSPGSLAQTVASPSVSRLTKSRIEDSGWWPTKSDRSRSEYIGASQCASCHVSESKNFSASAMAHAATRASDSPILREHDNLALQIGKYQYKIEKKGKVSVLKISDKHSSHSADLLWAFGVGRIAQTYVYDEGGHSYEGHVSFYTALQGLDVTPGHPRTEPPDLIAGTGRRISSEEKRRCFGCHTTASTTKEGFDSKKLVLGVTCEACHGPGAAHVAAVKSGDFDLALRSITNPAGLNGLDSVEFCGACHRTWQDVVSDGPTRIGPLNIRFAPYRLENSRCWREGTGDARITCVTCHDPHQPLVEDPAAYDSKCLQCHLAAGAQPVAQKSNDLQNDGHLSANHRTACTIGVKLCVTCHMPKFKSTGFHFTFTDHWIRIAESGSPLPD